MKVKIINKIFFCFLIFLLIHLFAGFTEKENDSPKRIKILLTQQEDKTILKISNANLLRKTKKDSIHYYQIFLYQKETFVEKIAEEVYKVDLNYDFWGDNYLVMEQGKVSDIKKGSTEEIPFVTKINLNTDYFLKDKKYLIKLIYFMTDKKTTWGYLIDKFFFLGKKKNWTFYSNTLKIN